MSQNPFDTPKTPDAHMASQQLQGGTGSFDLGRCLSEGWEATLRNFPLWLGVMIVGFICMMLSYVTIIGIFLLLPIFMWGFSRFYINMYDGNAEFGDLFAGFKRYGSALGSMLLLLLAFIVLGLPGQIISFVGAFAESSALSVLGTLISLVIALGVTIRLYFAVLFIVDQEMSAVDALKESWAATSGKWLPTFLLALLSGIVAMAGIIALGVGIIFTANISYLMWVSAYRQMVGAPRISG